MQRHRSMPPSLRWSLCAPAAKVRTAAGVCSRRAFGHTPLSAPRSGRQNKVREEIMLKRTVRLVGACVTTLALACSVSTASAEKITFKIASGHNSSWHFIQITQAFFMPELKFFVKQNTAYEIEFTEG